MDSSIYHSLTNGCRLETGHFFVTSNVSIEGHFNPMLNVLPLELPGPDSFYLMYLNTGCGQCGGKLKYNNKVIICKGSMWNANCAQADGFSWETVTFWQRMSHSMELVHPPIHKTYAECSTNWSDSACCTPVTARTKHAQSSQRIISQKACEFIIQILYILFLHMAWQQSWCDMSKVRPEYIILIY